MMPLNTCLSFVAFFGEVMEAFVGEAFLDSLLGMGVECIDSTHFLFFVSTVLWLKLTVSLSPALTITDSIT